ncbi:MAG: PilZ domain-containing protein [Acetivibrionales bacterium]
MGFDRHEEVFLSVYSIDYLLKCRVDENSGEIIKLSPLSGRNDMFQVHDPVVLLVYDTDLDMISADVAEIDPANGHVALRIRKKDIKEERRMYERYPVSLMVSARKRFSSKRINLMVRNISLYGMGVVSDVDLPEEEFLDIDLITDKNMFYFNSQIVWKNSIGNCFEYGLKLINYDIATKSYFEEYLKKLKESFLGMIPKAR